MNKEIRHRKTISIMEEIIGLYNNEILEKCEKMEVLKGIEEAVQYYYLKLKYEGEADKYGL